MFFHATLASAAALAAVEATEDVLAGFDPAVANGVTPQPPLCPEAIAVAAVSFVVLAEERFVPGGDAGGGAVALTGAPADQTTPTGAITI